MLEAEVKKRNVTAKHVVLLMVSIILVVAIAAAVYFFHQYQQDQQLLQNPTLAAQLQQSALLTQVEKLMVLPAGEVPQVATVSDVTKLQDQPFFAHATNGDKVLIYTKARTAILYDPTANKIINVAPVNLGNNTPVTPSIVVTPTRIPLQITPTPTK